MQNQHRAASIAWEAKCCQKQIWLRLRPSAKLSNVKLYHWKKQDFNYETPTVDQQKKTMFIELSVSPFTIPFLPPLSARRLNWLSSSLKAVRIKAHSRATTARSSAAVLHARMLRINSRSLIDMAPRFHRFGARSLFCPRKKPPKSEQLQGGACGFYWNTSVMSCHVFVFWVLW